MSTPRLSAAAFKRARKGSLAAHQELQAAALKLLALHRVPAIPLHTGPRVAPRAGGGFELRKNKEQRGAGDVLACLPPFGQLAFLEFKTGGASRSPEQIRVHEEFARAGAVCLVVRDVAELALFLSTRVAAPAPFTKTRETTCE